MNHKEQQNTVLEMEYSLVLLFISSIRTTDTFERSDGWKMYLWHLEKKKKCAK